MSRRQWKRSKEVAKIRKGMLASGCGSPGASSNHAIAHWSNVYPSNIKSDLQKALEKEVKRNQIDIKKQLEQQLYKSVMRESNRGITSSRPLTPEQLSEGINTKPIFVFEDRFPIQEPRNAGMVCYSGNATLAVPSTSNYRTIATKSKVYRLVEYDSYEIHTGLDGFKDGQLHKHSFRVTNPYIESIRPNFSSFEKAIHEVIKRELGAQIKNQAYQNMPSFNENAITASQIRDSQINAQSIKSVKYEMNGLTNIFSSQFSDEEWLNYRVEEICNISTI